MATATNKDWISIGTDVVISLFALGGSFLLNALPEIDSKSFIIGFAQIGSLLIFLFIKFFVISNKGTNGFFIRFAVIMAVAFFISALSYYEFKKSHTRFIARENMVVVKGKLRNDVLAVCARTGKPTADCEDWYLSIITSDKLDSVWTPGSVGRNTTVIILLYALIVFSLSAALFSIVELLNRVAPINPEEKQNDAKGEDPKSKAYLAETI